MLRTVCSWPTAELGASTCERLLADLVVPRPIAWISTLSRDGVANLAPFSSFSALAAEPPLVAVAIARHPDNRIKDTLLNIRETRVFCVNLVTAPLLAAMRRTAEPLPPETDEFAFAELTQAHGAAVPAPYVAEAEAVLECRVFREIDLAPAPATLVIGRVMTFRVAGATQSPPDEVRCSRRSATVGHVGIDEFVQVGEAAPGSGTRADRE